MSYKSDVKCVFGSKDSVRLHAFAARTLEQAKEHDLLDRFFFAKHSEHPLFLFAKDNTGWHDEWGHCAWFMQVLEDLDEDEHIGYCFYRLGEEDGDEERLENDVGSELGLDTLLGVERKISWFIEGVDNV